MWRAPGGGEGPWGRGWPALAADGARLQGRRGHRLRPETSTWLSFGFAALLVALAASGAAALWPLGVGVAVGYLALFPFGHLPAIWWGCRGCAKRGRRCVVIPRGGRIAARYLPAALPPGRRARGLAVGWLFGWYGLPAVAASLGADPRAAAVHAGLVLTWALLRRTATQVVFDGWGSAPGPARLTGRRWTAS